MSTPAPYQDPFVTLCYNIRKAVQQFRHNDDNSPSLFHPAKGFIYGYDIKQVERALREYELEIDTEFSLDLKTVSQVD